jgi:hypothetical protein
MHKAQTQFFLFIARRVLKADVEQKAGEGDGKVKDQTAQVV